MSDIERKISNYDERKINYEGRRKNIGVRMTDNGRGLLTLNKLHKGIYGEKLPKKCAILPYFVINIALRYHGYSQYLRRCLTFAVVLTKIHVSNYAVGNRKD